MSETKLKDARFGRFLGGFTSEGTIGDTGCLKITNQDLQFIHQIVQSAVDVFGNEIVTKNPPTPEHVKDKNAFTYHKYLSTKFGKFLINEVGIKPGRRILNDQGLPDFINNWQKSGFDYQNFVDWLRNYLQARFSGDGWVSLNSKRIGITKAKAVNFDNKIKNEIWSLYSKGKKIKEYPKDAIEKLKNEGRKSYNFPREFVELKEILNIFFNINSKIDLGGVRTIYRDNKRNVLIVSCFYRLNISKQENVKKFRDKINFLEFDEFNRERLDSIILEN